MKSHFHIKHRTPNQRQYICFVQFNRWWHQSDVRQHCLVEITRWRQWATGEGRSLPSPTASCYLCTGIRACI